MLISFVNYPVFHLTRLVPSHSNCHLPFHPLARLSTTTTTIPNAYCLHRTAL